MGIEDAVRSLESQGLSVKRPRKGVFIIKGLADHFGLDAKADFRALDANYPKRSGAEPIQWGQPQWVQGDHVALQYRGNALKRRKMWFQRGDPLFQGFTKYYYTGWQKRVLPATANVEDVPCLDHFTCSVNGWLAGHDVMTTNHFIVTAYDTEKDSIGMHSDKAKSIYDDSVILVVKLGEAGRPFKLTEGETTLYEDVVPPGAAVLMTMEANLATKHGVPALDAPTGLSGSIVLRSIHERVGWNELDRILQADERKRKRRATVDEPPPNKKRALEREDAAVPPEWCEESEEEP